MRKLVAIVLVLAMVLSMGTIAFAFEDVEGHWAEDAIRTWNARGIVNGKDADTFDPNGHMKRGEAATLFAKLLGLTEMADITAYGDVDADDWYAEALAKCVAAGIMNGVSDSAMDPEGTITREMFFTMFARALGIKPEAKTEKDFDDHNEVSDWAEGYVNALINNGYVSGMTEETIEPEMNINRASVMSLLHKTVKHYVTEDGATVDASDIAEEGGIILVVADDVKIENAPEGSVIVTAPETTGTVANGTKIEEDTFHEIEAEVPVVSGGGGRPSSGGSDDEVITTVPTTTRPTTTTTEEVTTTPTQE